MSNAARYWSYVDAFEYRAVEPDQGTSANPPKREWVHIGLRMYFDWEAYYRAHVFKAESGETE